MHDTSKAGRDYGRRKVRRTDSTTDGDPEKRSDDELIAGPPHAHWMFRGRAAARRLGGAGE